MARAPDIIMVQRSHYSLITTASLTSLALTGAIVVSCGAYKNYEERADYAEDQDQADYSCPNGVCVADPGSRALSAEDCAAAEDGYEFLPLPVMDLEDQRTVTDAKTGASSNENYALLSYTYDDSTTEALEPHGWEPTAVVDPWSRCGKTDNHVLRLQGGPFLEWGGGIGRSLRCMNGNYKTAQSLMTEANRFWADRFEPGTLPGGQTDSITAPQLDNVYCHGEGTYAAGACALAALDPATLSDEQQLALEACPERDRALKTLDHTPTLDDVTSEDLPLIGMAVDLSQWEGISFWARRTPNSQAGIRALVGDRRTDDDISFLQFFSNPEAEPYCRRALECACKDQNKPCTVLTEEDLASWAPVGNDLNPPKVGDSVCWDPETDGPFADVEEVLYCGNSACMHQPDSAKSLNVTVDPVYYDTQCLEYSFRGSVTSSYCYNPDSEWAVQQQPTEASSTCGDHWMYSVKLSYDWEFYAIPFTSLLQQGWSKRQYLLDLTAITMARITWGQGYLDVYLDDVRFYRKKQ